jgi:hypothetical protein
MSAGASPCSAASASSMAGSVRAGLAAIGAVRSSARSHALAGEFLAGSRFESGLCTFMVNAWRRCGRA